ncbi:IclR family transcriptional regulator [Pararhodobacter oceanensis]|uniref:IclR family transcriptional regulator n=1 Tax=Pararhodobacter oceanensis TaxID=2172121 RepID=UPI003A8FD6A3
MTNVQPDIPLKDISLTFMKGMTVLRAFDDTHSHLSLAEIARLTGFERAAVRRLVLTLVHLGYVHKDDNRYSLTPRVLVLGSGFLRGNQFGRRVQPLIELCAREVGYSVSLAMRDGPSAVYVAQSSQQNARYTFGFTIGSRLPLLSTAIGRMLLAWGDETWAQEMLETLPIERFTPNTLMERDAIAAAIASIREAGMSIVEGEFETGAVGIAVPVGAMHRAEAALGISEPMSELSAADYPRRAEILHRYANQIADELR